MTYSLTDMTSLGNITSEESTKDAQLFQMALAAQDADKAIMLDLFGTFRTINISGIYTGTPAEIATFVNQLDALCNGQQTRRTYHSDKSGLSYYVRIGNIKWNYAEAEVNSVDYSISMIESAT